MLFFSVGIAENVSSGQRHTEHTVSSSLEALFSYRNVV